MGSLLGNIRDRSKSLFGRSVPSKPISGGYNEIVRGGLGKRIGSLGNRPTLFQEDYFSGLGSYRRIQRPSISVGYESYEKLSSDILGSYPAEEVRNIFANSNPNVSRAINDFRKFVNPGWVLQPAAHPLFNLLFDNMSRYDEDLDLLINGLSDSLFKDGAIFTELILSDILHPRRVIGIPAYTAEFRVGTSEDGEFPELGQYDRDSKDLFKSFYDDPTVKFFPFLPEIGNPYGRLIMDSAIYHLLMVKGFFQSYKEAIASIIWPNLLISVKREVLQNLPPADQNRIVSEIVAQVADDIGKLKPGGVVVYPDEVEIGGYISGMNRTNLGAVTDCINIMNNEIMRALESESVLFGMTEGLAETHVTQQMRNYGYFIRLAQGVINKVLTYYFNYILYVGDSRESADFRLKFAIAEEKLEAARVYQMQREAFKTSSEDFEALVMGISAAVERNLWTSDEANAYFASQMEMRKEVDLFPSGY